MIQRTEDVLVDRIRELVKDSETSGPTELGQSSDPGEGLALEQGLDGGCDAEESGEGEAGARQHSVVGVGLREWGNYGFFDPGNRETEEGRREREGSSRLWDEGEVA